MAGGATEAATGAAIITLDDVGTGPSDGTTLLATGAVINGAGAATANGGAATEAAMLTADNGWLSPATSACADVGDMATADASRLRLRVHLRLWITSNGRFLRERRLLDPAAAEAAAPPRLEDRRLWPPLTSAAACAAEWREVDFAEVAGVLVL